MSFEINERVLIHNIYTVPTFSSYFRNYFTSAVFAKLQHGDPYGRISIMALFNYIMRKVWYHQTRIGLSLYDVVGQGYLREVVSCVHCSDYSFSSKVHGEKVT